MDNSSISFESLQSILKGCPIPPAAPRTATLEETVEELLKYRTVVFAAVDEKEETIRE
jgi:hypothetical protein